MPTDIGVPFPPDWRGYPPHMSQRDLLIWRTWYPGVARDAIALYFDVALGEGTYTPPKTPPDLARMWLRLNQKRADVVMQRASDIVIIELRASASASAIGRLLLYKKLYLQDPVLGTQLQLYLVTDRLDAPTQELAQESGILPIIVT